MSDERRVLDLFFSGIVVHTVNVLGVIIKFVGQILDRGYEVGGGWEAKFSTVNP